MCNNLCRIMGKIVSVRNNKNPVLLFLLCCCESYLGSVVESEKPIFVCYSTRLGFHFVRKSLVYSTSKVLKRLYKLCFVFFLRFCCCLFCVCLLQDFIWRCLADNPASRATVRDLLLDPYLFEVRKTVHHNNNNSHKNS